MPDPDLSILDLVDTPLLVLRTEPLRIVSANPAALEMLGPDWRPAFPCSFDRFGGPAATTALSEILGGGSRAPRPARFQADLDLDGQHRSFLCKPAQMPDHVGYCIVTVAETNAASLSRWQGSLVEVLHALPVAVEIYDEDMNARFFNKASDELFMYEGKLIVHHDDWWDAGFPDEALRRAAIEEWRQAFRAARLAPRVPQLTEWSVRCRDGRDRIMQFRYLWTGTYYILMLWEVTEQRQLEDRLNQLAASDPLTGLWNRRRFLEAADQAFAQSRSSRMPLAAMMLDIDHFKAINDTYGHDAGDDVIRAVAKRCRRTLRGHDGLARWGGEEFAVVLPGTDITAAESVAQRLRKAIARTSVRTGHDAIEVRVSLGVTCASAEDDDFSSVLSRADRALYKAKGLGRNRVVLDI